MFKSEIYFKKNRTCSTPRTDVPKHLQDSTSPSNASHSSSLKLPQNLSPATCPHSTSSGRSISPFHWRYLNSCSMAMAIWPRPLDRSWTMVQWSTQPGAIGLISTQVIVPGSACCLRDWGMINLGICWHQRHPCRQTWVHTCINMYVCVWRYVHAIHRLQRLAAVCSTFSMVRKHQYMPISHCKAKKTSNTLPVFLWFDNLPLKKKNGVCSVHQCYPTLAPYHRWLRLGTAYPAELPTPQHRYVESTRSIDTSIMSNIQGYM